MPPKKMGARTALRLPPHAVPDGEGRTRCGVDEASENEALHRELVGPHVLLSLTFVLQLFKGRMALSWLLSSSGSNRLLEQNVLS